MGNGTIVKIDSSQELEVSSEGRLLTHLAPMVTMASSFVVSSLAFGIGSFSTLFVAGVGYLAALTFTRTNKMKRMWEEVYSTHNIKIDGEDYKEYRAVLSPKNKRVRMLSAIPFLATTHTEFLPSGASVRISSKLNTLHVIYNGEHEDNDASLFDEAFIAALELSGNSFETMASFVANEVEAEEEEKNYQHFRKYRSFDFDDGYDIEYSVARNCRVDRTTKYW